MSKRNEKAKRLNANEDNLLQMEMERFEKQHNKEMKSILLERQTVKEAMSGVRRQRASSLLAARMVLLETNALNNCSDNSPTLSEKVFCEAKQNQVSSKMVPGLETDEDRSSLWKTSLPNPTQKESDLGREFLDNCNMTSLPSKNDHFGRPRKRAQTFTEGTTTSKIAQSSVTLKNTLIVQKPLLPNPPQKTSNRALKSSEYLNVPYLASKIDHLEKSRIRPRSFTEGTTDARSDVEGACSLSGSRLNPITISINLANQYREHQGNPAVKNIPFLTESVVNDNRPRSRSDDSMLLKREPTPNSGFEKRNLSPNGLSSARSRQNSPEPDSFHSPLILRVPLLRPPPTNRRISLETSRLFAKRSSLEFPNKSLTQPQNKLSPSRGIAKFRQTGSAAFAVQALVSRYQREKAISNATENLIAQRQRRGKVRQEHQQMKEDWKKAGCTRTTGLKESFFTVAQLVMALNAVKKAASGGSTFVEK